MMPKKKIGIALLVLLCAVMGILCKFVGNAPKEIIYFWALAGLIWTYNLILECLR